jgi:hypothetical protein
MIEMVGATLAVGAPPLVEEFAITPLLFTVGRRVHRSFERDAASNPSSSHRDDPDFRADRSEPH